MSTADILRLKKVIVLNTVDRFKDLQKNILEELDVDVVVVVVLNGKKGVKIVSGEEFSQDQFDIVDFKDKFPKEHFSVLMDNYFSSSELMCLSIFSEYEVFLINYGVYLCRDEISMSFPRFRKFSSIGMGINHVKIRIKAYYQGLRYFSKFVDVRGLVYSSRTLIFWNGTSRDNFLRDYPFALARNLGLYERAVGTLPSKCVPEHVLLAPSAIGHSRLTLQEELMYWKDITLVLSALGVRSIVLSIHPMYEQNKTFILEKKVFDDVICGISMTELKSFDLILTDTSTLYWMAPLYGVRSKRLRGYMIPSDYYGYIHEDF